MRDGLRFSVAMNEYVLSAICITLITVGVGFEYAYVHPVAVPAPCPAVASLPTIEIQQTINVPVPAPPTVTPPDEFTPDPNLEKPQEDTDPVFENRTPIITDALRQPMTYAKNK